MAQAPQTTQPKITINPDFTGVYSGNGDRGYFRTMYDQKVLFSDMQAQYPDIELPYNEEVGFKHYHATDCACFTLKDGTVIVVDPLGRVYPANEYETHSRSLDLIQKLHQTVFSQYGCTEEKVNEFVNSLDDKFFLEDDFHKAVVRLNAQYHRLAVEACRKNNTKININKIEKSMKKFEKLCNNKRTAAIKRQEKEKIEDDIIDSHMQ